VVPGHATCTPPRLATHAATLLTPPSPLLLLPAQTYEFQLVVKQPSDERQPPEQLLERYRRIVADTTAGDIPAEACTIKERLGGKFVSLCIPARVQAAHVVDLVWAALADDPALVMKY